jgi:NAD-reducing hydrogenase small subunit
MRDDDNGQTQTLGFWPIRHLKEPDMAKVLIATDWLAACAGCHMSLLDIDERIVDLLQQMTFTSSPVTDLKHPPATGVTVGVLTGAISNTHNIEVARGMRSRCQYLVAVGDCATFGGIVAARNLVGTSAALKRAYLETESTVDGLIPDSPELGMPLETVTGVGDVVKVDVFLPGCPPRPQDFHYVFAELLAGRLPIVLPAQHFRYD